MILDWRSCWTDGAESDFMSGLHTECLGTRFSLVDVLDAADADELMTLVTLGGSFSLILTFVLEECS